VRGTLAVTGDADADELLNTDPFALLVGMLLDQQVPISWAFRGPATLRSRLGHLDPVKLAAMDPDDVVAACAARPAIHRFPAAMGVRIHQLAEVVGAQYRGDAARIWKGVRTGTELERRLRALPGFGEEKAQIFVALLAKRFGVRSEGWEAAAGVFADEVPRTVADIDSPASLARVKAFKQEMRATSRDKQGRPTASASSPLSAQP
jgi:uncharacterized HhH-GPD family protein